MMGLGRVTRLVRRTTRVEQRLAIACVLSFIGQAAILNSCSRAAAAGPSGGDVVAIQNGAANAELITNAYTGEVMIHTWNRKLEKLEPIEAVPMTLGSGDYTVEVQPHPVASDPPGRCSRFYGQAGWIRGGRIDHGWLRCCGAQGTRQDMAWKRCWSGGRGQGEMWTEMGEHRRGGAGHHVGGHR